MQTRYIKRVSFRVYEEKSIPENEKNEACLSLKREKVSERGEGRR